ncbi:MAG: 3-oxoacyl-ACP synthase [Bacteroidota bacterium]
MNKAQLIAHICTVVEDKIKLLQERFDDLTSDLVSDHKSSAGDKHETGRAMTQLEQEKLAGQMADFARQKETISQLSLEVKSSVQLGSLVTTSKGMFFISIGLGKVQISDEQIFCISISSPIGQVLQHKKVGESTFFNGDTIEILGLC